MRGAASRREGTGRRWRCAAALAAALLAASLPPAAPATAGETLTWAQAEMGYPPYTMPEGWGKPGIYDEMLERIAELTGDRFERIYMPVNRSDTLFAMGRMDMRVLVNPDWLSPRERDVSVFTEPLFVAEEVLVFPRGRAFPFTGRPGELQGKRIATVVGYRYPRFAEEFERQDSINEVNMLRMVAAGRVDAGIINVVVGRYLARTEGVQGVEFGPVYMTGPRVIRLHRNRAGALDRLNDAIRRLKHEGTFDRIIGSYVEQG